MSKARFGLLILLIAGPILWFVTDYGAFHPRSPLATPAMMALVAYFVVVPIALYAVSGERFLRILLSCVWLAWVVAMSIGVYRMYTS